MMELVPLWKRKGESSLSVADQEESSPEPNHAGTLRNCERVNVCFLSQPVCGVLLWQLQLTSTGPSQDITKLIPHTVLLESTALSLMETGMQNCLNECARQCFCGIKRYQYVRPSPQKKKKSAKYQEPTCLSTH